MILGTGVKQAGRYKIENLRSQQLEKKSESPRNKTVFGRRRKIIKEKGCQWQEVTATQTHG